MLDVLEVELICAGSVCRIKCRKNHSSHGVNPSDVSMKLQKEIIWQHHCVVTVAK